jgi:predicted NUDIX family NTP pyrophosphohydrolase
MPQRSAGLLMYRRTHRGPEVFLVHPGGPYWERKEVGVWTVPKGLFEEGEAPLEAACREFREETGFTASGPFLPLGEARTRNGKLVSVWAFEGDADPAALASNTFSIEWPPHSGKWREFPEADRGAWFSLPDARTRIAAVQTVFLDRLAAALEPAATAPGSREPAP